MTELTRGDFAGREVESKHWTPLPSSLLPCSHKPNLKGSQWARRSDDIVTNTGGQLPVTENRVEGWTVHLGRQIKVIQLRNWS